MKPTFTASQFTVTQYSTAEDKAKFANHFVRFAESGFKRTLFYQWFYHRLSNTFGHIANFNSDGFYAAFFKSTQNTVQFLRWCEAHPCYGDVAYTYSDVEKALLPYVREKLASYNVLLLEEIEASERADLARLQAKYHAS